MKTWLSVLASTLFVSVALAEPPVGALPANDAVSQLVNEKLLTPLQKSERKRSKFSRAAPVPLQRRVRVLDAEAVRDGRGKEFVRFAIDERRAFDDKTAWSEDSIVGCAYVKEHEVFVRDEASYRPAKSLLGADVKDRTDVCTAAAG